MASAQSMTFGLCRVHQSVHKHQAHHHFLMMMLMQPASEPAGELAQMRGESGKCGRKCD